MPTITRCSAAEFLAGVHPAPSREAVAIQITDPCCAAPRAGDQYHALHHFEFTDTERASELTGEFAINNDQARSIAVILRDALAEGRDVVVHCQAGIYRSGGVAEAARRCGFDYVNRMERESFASVFNHRVRDLVAINFYRLGERHA
ncbi:MAG: hypothetical protein Q7U48_13760 [Hydrogenophaga sp.]|nr:hypothetical protein [Hydrogenophaga sp.]